MKILYLRFYISSTILVLAFAFPAWGDDQPGTGTPQENVAPVSASARGTAAATIISMKVGCERILRSVAVDFYEPVETPSHNLAPIRITCDPETGDSSIHIDMGAATIGSAYARAAPPRDRSTAYILARDRQATDWPANGNKGHKHVVRILYNLE